MDEFNFAKKMQEMGVDEKVASQLKSQLKGGDYVNLVSALQQTDLATSLKQVSSILSKYGIKLKEDTTMSNDYLSSMFKGIKSGKTTNEASVIEGLTPMEISGQPDAQALKSDGFNYMAAVSPSATDKLSDWLDAAKVDYMTDGTGHFQIKCPDRDMAYKVGRMVTGLGTKDIVSDDEIQSRDVMEAKKNDAAKRERAAKEKIANLKQRDPALLALSQRTGKGAHTTNPRKADPQDRKAKHKRTPMEESYEFSAGDRVMVGEVEGTVKIPRGPDGTIGVVLNNELSMVESATVNRMDEAALGMTAVSPLFRLRELAGLAPAPAMAPQLDIKKKMAAAPLEGLDDDFSDIQMGDEMGDEMAPETPVMGAPAPDLGGMDAMAAAPAGMDVPADDFSDLDAPAPDAGIAPMGADPAMGGVPGDLPPMGMDAPMMMPSQSDAMSAIEDNLNNVQNKLAEIRLSEYKTLIQKLQDLTTQVQMMGRDYLGEQRRKK
jgi:hypothetical protein